MSEDMSGWRECKLGEIITLEYGKALQNYREGKGIYVVFGTNGNIGLTDTFIYDKPALIIGRKGAYRGVHLSIKPFFVIDTAFYTKNKIKDLDIVYLYYWFKCVDINSMDSGSAIPSTSRDEIYELDILLPTPPEQKAIANVLSSLDDKIDLLHRQNETLESMAETLFRQWFLEEAQEGWEKKSLLDIFELIGGGTPKTSVSEYWAGDIPWLSGGDIALNHKSFIISYEKEISKKGIDKSSAKLLPKFTTIITARGTVGKYALLSVPMTFSQSNYGIIPKIKDCFFFNYLLIDHVVKELQSSSYGSVFDTITTATFKNIIVSIPSEEMIKDFEANISIYFQKKLHCLTRIETLEKLRDTLLPKLMRGEVTVIN